MTTTTTEFQRQHSTFECTEPKGTSFMTEPMHPSAAFVGGIRRRQPKRRERRPQTQCVRRQRRQRRERIGAACGGRLTAAELQEASQVAKLSLKASQSWAALELEREEEPFAEVKLASLTLGDHLLEKTQQEQGQTGQNQDEGQPPSPFHLKRQREQQMSSPFSTLFSSLPRPPRWPTTKKRTTTTQEDEEEEEEKQPAPCKRRTEKRVRFEGDAETLDSPPAQVLEFDPEAAPSEISSDKSSTSSSDEEEEEARKAIFARRGRPLLARPGREARVRQARKDAEEICSLELDTLEDAADRLGAGERMLLLLKSLQQLVIFWEGEEKRTEPKFRFLGLEDDDMRAIREHLSEADERITAAEQNLREAFAQMCEARRWLQNPQKARLERSQRRAEALRAAKSYP